MNNTAYISLSRQAATRRQMEMIANNIANTSTPAFRAERLMFAEYVGKGAMSFVQDVGVVRDLREGAIAQTGNPLDIAIKGEGFFTMELAGETYYTRNGRFRLDDEGKIINGGGALLLDEAGKPIKLGDQVVRIEISRDGTVSTENGQAGKIRLVRFENEQLLSAVNDGLFKTDQPALPATNATTNQGMLEESNVQPVVEITNMIEAMRSYQNAQQMITNEHDRVLKSIEALTRAA